MTEETKEEKKETEETPIEVEEPAYEEEIIKSLKPKKEKETVAEEKEEEKSEEEERETPAEEEQPVEEEKPKERPKKKKPKKEEKIAVTEEKKSDMNLIFALRTTANREDQVLDFVTSNIEKKGLEVYSLISPHGLRGYIFLEAKDRQVAEEAFQGVPYARGLLPNLVRYEEIEHMLEQVKREVNIQKNDIVEIITGPFKREKAKVTRIDQQKEEVVVELLESAIPIPVTVKLDSVKVIRRETEEKTEEKEE